MAISVGIAVLCLVHLVLGLDIQYHSGEYSNYKPLDPSVVERQYNHRTEKDSEIEDQCHLIQFQYVGRHGARYPFGGMVQKFLDLEAKIRKIKQEANIPHFLRAWNTSLFTDHRTYGDLSPKGVQELYSLGKRLKEREPGLQKLFSWQDHSKISVMHKEDPNSVVNNWDSDLYRFQSSEYIHTARSASAFSFGLFEGQGTIGNTSMSSKHKFSYQPVYIESTGEVTKRLTGYNEIQAQCPIIKKLAQKTDKSNSVKKNLLEPIGVRLSTEWKIQSRWNISGSDVAVMLEICAFEATLDENYSQFCSIFSDEDIMMWERARDIINYYRESYGFPPAYESAAPLIQEIFVVMDKRINDPLNSQRSFIRFGHHQTVGTLLTALKLFEYETPIHDAMYEPGNTSPWLSSRLTPYMGHIGFYLYDCGTQHRTPYRHYVKLMVNELEISIPGVSIYCPYSQFWNVFASKLQLNMDTLCDEYNKKFLPPKATPAPNYIYEHEVDPDESTMELYVLVVFMLGISIGLLGKSFCSRFLSLVFVSNPKEKRIV